MAKKRITKKTWKGNPAVEAALKAVREDQRREASLAAIQALVPVGLAAVADRLRRDLEILAGHKSQRDGVGYRWGSNNGSVYLGDQKVHMKVPRVRSKEDEREIPLPSYEELQSPRVIEDVLLRRVIAGISGERYEEAALCVPETFGISRDSVSRKYIRASGRKLRLFRTRSLKKLDIVAMILDGKTFGANEIILALGITIAGRKVPLGFIEASTEKYEVCRDFLNGLIDRGLSIENEMLVVIDGGKGLRKAVQVVLGEKAFVQRCQWHKRENVVGYLPKERQGEFREKLQAAYELPTYEAAKTRLRSLERELKGINTSAAASLTEGMEETLTLHRLGLFEKLGTSFKTTNMIENVNGLLERSTGRVTRWRNSDQRQRWVGTALLDIEPRLKKVRGYRHLPALRTAMREAVMRKVQPTELRKVA
ncbi:MAG: transposase [Elusimicrobia bacterium]|nr:transposase [Elusimicrobiota bacterium]